MIKINDVSLCFCNMGLFDTQDEWIHPTVTVDTHELILVVEGTVNIREGDTEYSLKKGDMIVLCPGIEHGGTQISHTHTAFYWLHFSTDDLSRFGVPKASTPSAARAERYMKDIMQCQMRGEGHVAELVLARFLFECASTVERHGKAAYEIDEYIRANSQKSITVADVACRFGYAPDHVSRILRAEFGRSAKELIVEKRLAYVENQLLNTNESIKAVALRCGFEDENAFVKFFKYHEHTTPTDFRNEYFRIHMNTH